MALEETSDRSSEEALALAQRLFDAARAGDGALLGQYLDAGVPAGLTNAAGDSLLMLSAYNGHAEVVSDLIRRGAAVDALNDHGQTPLAGAVFKGYSNVCRVLVEAGADPDAGAPTARVTARMFSREEILPLFGAQN